MSEAVESLGEGRFIFSLNYPHRICPQAPAPGSAKNENRQVGECILVLTKRTPLQVQKLVVALYSR